MRPGHGRLIRGAGLLAVLAGCAASVGGEVQAGTGPGQSIEPRQGFAAPDTPPGTTTLISRRGDEGFARGASGQPSISATGRWIAFASAADDLVKVDGNRALDVFLFDVKTGKTIKLPGLGGRPLPLGTAGFDPSIAADGSVVAFTVQPSQTAALLAAPALPFVIAWTRATGETEVVSIAPNGNVARGSTEASVSGNGRLVAFTSVTPAGPLDGNGASDVFVRDRRTARTTLVSESRTGGGTGKGASRGPSISQDGRIVAFASNASDLVRDDDNGATDVFARNLVSESTSLVSVALSGTSNGPSTDPAVSANGRFVAFEATASNLAPGVPAGTRAVYRRDRTTKTTALASVNAVGGAAAGQSGQAAIDPDGRIVAFTSSATDLVAEGPGAVDVAVIQGRTEVYAHDMVSGETIRVSEAQAGGPGGSASMTPVIGGDGRFIAFASTSIRLVTADDNQAADVFMRDLPPVPVTEPAVVDFGSRSVGAPGPPEAATLRNEGWGLLRGDGTTLAGPQAGDFDLVTDGCEGTRLYHMDSCLVSISFKPKASGIRKGSLRIADSFGPPGTVALRGRAADAVVELDPPLGPPGIVTVVRGSGFPPDTPVRLAWSQGISGALPPVISDEQGNFQVGMLVFHNDLIGSRQLIVSPMVGATFKPFDAPFLVVTAKSQPPGFLERALFSGLPPLVMRR